MTDTQRSDQAADSSLFAGLVKTGALVGALTWVLILVSFVAALNGPAHASGLNALGPLLALVVATPIFFIFVLPALLFSFLGGASGAKAGAGFLLGGLLVAGIFLGGPVLRLIF